MDNMIYVFFGLVGALVGIGIFVGGIFTGIGWCQCRREFNGADEVRREEPAAVEPTEDEARKLAEERERLREEQKAFHDLIGYNADVAYGISKREG